MFTNFTIYDIINIVSEKQKKKVFQKRLEKIMKDYSDDEDLKETVSKLNLIVNEINHKN